MNPSTGGHYESESFYPYAGFMCFICRSYCGVLPDYHSYPAGAHYPWYLCGAHGRRFPWQAVRSSGHCDLSAPWHGRGAGIFHDARRFSVIAGPSGGFIIGFAPMAFVVGLVSEKLGYSFKNMLAATIAGTAVCYIMGLAWFMFLTGTGIWASMVMCMFPFLPGDFAKILLASFLVSKYRRRLVGEF